MLRQTDKQMHAGIANYKLQGCSRNLSHFVMCNEVDIFTVAMHLLLGLMPRLYI